MSTPRQIPRNLVLRRQIKRPKFTAVDRAVLVAGSAITSTWRDSILLVKPDTILRWHRRAFQLLWQWKSKPKRSEPRTSPETIELIRRMADDNHLWGAERIRGELLKLGIHVAKRTIQRYLKASAKPHPEGQRWSTFLKNHGTDIWACDFLQTCDIWFRPIFAFFIVNLGTREVWTSPSRARRRVRGPRGSSATRRRLASGLASLFGTVTTSSAPTSTEPRIAIGFDFGLRYKSVYSQIPGEE